MNLVAVPIEAIPQEWPKIAAVLAPAIDRDPKRDAWEVMGELFSGGMRLWRGSDGASGYVVTQHLGSTLWVIYAAGAGHSLIGLRELMGIIEEKARRLDCTLVRFEGRDWRRVFPDYVARLKAGRWHFRKVLK